ncbi:hypothetical protein L6274_02205 [Candidatus Parcubacteria bacterium]|nr:hypothetical protein [Candidatus Parcubacteria bacterium]
MDKKETINNLINTVSKNEKLKEAMIGISNDQCLSDGVDDLKKRNDFFAFLGISLALLAYSKIITLNNETDYCESSQDEKTIAYLAEKVQKNKTLFNLITDIINNETGEEEPKVRYRIFLTTALSLLVGRHMITINENWNSKSPY